MPGVSDGFVKRAAGMGMFTRIVDDVCFLRLNGYHLLKGIISYEGLKGPVQIEEG